MLIYMTKIEKKNKTDILQTCLSYNWFDVRVHKSFMKVKKSYNIFLAKKN